jgi:hypothetical protein
MNFAWGILKRKSGLSLTYIKGSIKNTAKKNKLTMVLAL